MNDERRQQSALQEIIRRSPGHIRLPSPWSWLKLQSQGMASINYPVAPEQKAIEFLGNSEYQNIRNGGKAEPG